jgi:hypothetical protein
MGLLTRIAATAPAGSREGQPALSLEQTAAIEGAAIGADFINLTLGDGLFFGDGSARQISYPTTL